MPIYAEWDNSNHTIIRIHVHDPWKIEEYFEGTDHAHVLMSTVAHPVHLLYDLTDSFNVPRDLLSSLRRIDQHFVPPQGLTICVKTPLYLKAVMQMGIRVFPRLGHNLFFIETLQDAYDLISKYDRTGRL